jgi:hypothetical protein
MTEAVEGIASVVEQLNERVRDLEHRISILEAQPREPIAPAVATPTVPETPSSRPNSLAFPSPESPTGAVPVLGKAVLGVAGAYLLRALAESGSIPKLPVLAVAILYAGLWMIWAVRTHTANRFAGVTYGMTSALILSPLLWESTVHFQTLSPAATAAVLVAYAVLTLALARRRGLQIIPSIAVLASVTTALALIFATHAIVPFTASLLAVALASEITLCIGHPLRVRAIPAVAADVAIWMLVDVMTSSTVVPEGFSPSSPAVLTALCLALFVIYGGTIGVRSFWLRQRITIFEIGQGTLACVLAVFGTLRATHNAAAPALGVFFLLLAATCYWGALSRFSEGPYTRNRRVSANWAAALLLSGSLVVLPTNLQVLFWCLAAMLAALVYARTAKISLGLHASVFLAAAVAVSALPAYVINALSRSVPTFPPWSAWVVAAAAAICYAVGSRRQEEQSIRRLLWVVPAVVVGFTGTALAVAAIAGLAAGHVDLAASRLSVVRTIVNCALALGLGLLSSHWKRVELGWVAYSALAFGTLKLLFEDLRFGNAASLVVSLLFYGLVLILLPRLTNYRRGEARGNV